MEDHAATAAALLLRRRRGTAQSGVEGAAVAAFRFKVGVIPLLLGCAAIGVGLYLAGWV